MPVYLIIPVLNYFESVHASGQDPLSNSNSETGSPTRWTQSGANWIAGCWFGIETYRSSAHSVANATITWDSNGRVCSALACPSNQAKWDLTLL